jgi:hypothetical protein
MSGAAAVIAVARVHGRRIVIGHGSIRNHRLRITYRHLHRGPYRVALLEQSHHHSLLIEDTTIVVT